MPAIELTANDLQRVIDTHDIVLIDFWAEWCGPCRVFGPVFESAAESHPDIAFAKVNTEEELELAAAFNVRSIPTLAVFREKSLVFMQPGALPAPALEELIGQVRKLDMDEVRAEIAKHERKQGDGARDQTAP